MRLRRQLTKGKTQTKIREREGHIDTDAIRISIFDQGGSAFGGNCSGFCTVGSARCRANV
jgi:hypothetical protein